LNPADRKKYGHPDYSDRQVDGLMHYFKFNTYAEFQGFLKRCRNDESADAA
jgi:hypothetical protein